AECFLPRCRDESHVEPVGGVPGKFFDEHESDKRDSPGRQVSRGQTHLGSATKSATANSIAAPQLADSGSGDHRRPQPGSNQCVARRPVAGVAADVRRRKPFTKRKSSPCLPSASLRRRLQRHCLASRPRLVQTSFMPLTPKRKLPRLERHHYRGHAVVFWTVTLENRERGRLGDSFHARFRELILHAAARESPVCPGYCVMPDHLHRMLQGVRRESAQHHTEDVHCTRL